MQIAYTTLQTYTGRGLRGDMIETYKIVSGKYDSLAAPMLPSPHSYVTRGHDLRVRLQKNRARYDLRKFFSLTELTGTDLIHSGPIKIWYITSKPKLAEPEVEVKLYSNYYNNTLY